MNRKRFDSSQAGYTLIELMIVVVILGLLASIVFPRYDLVLLRAHQSKTKSNLGALRTTISLYYSDTEGHFPLEGYSDGNGHYTLDGASFSSVLTPKWLDYVPVPLLKERLGTFNGLTANWDILMTSLIKKASPDDVYILQGPADYTPMLVAPYAFDNHAGVVYIPNGNYDLGGRYFYEW